MAVIGCHMNTQPIRGHLEDSQPISAFPNDDIIRLVTRPRLLSSFSVKTFTHHPKSKSRPTGVCLTPRGDYIISDFSEGTIKIFNKMGQLKLEFGQKHLKRPWNCIQMTNGNLAVSDPEDMAIKIFTMQGEFIKTFEYSKNLQEPYGLALNSEGEILVADKGANCVYKHNSDGFMVGSVKGKPNTSLATWPQYLCTDHHDNVIISDYMDHKVSCYDNQGQRRFQHGGMGMGKSQLMCPQGICVDHLGNILVVDNANERIKLLTSCGEHIIDLVTKQQGLECPEALTLNKDGDLVITEGKSGEVKVFSYLL